LVVRAPPNRGERDGFIEIADEAQRPVIAAAFDLSAAVTEFMREPSATRH
jgi:hypothetical protein